MHCVLLLIFSSFLRGIRCRSVCRETLVPHQTLTQWSPHVSVQIVLDRSQDMDTFML